MSSFLVSTISGLILGSSVFIWQLSIALLLIKKLFFGRRRKIKLSDLSFDEKAVQFTAITVCFFFALSGFTIATVYIYKLRTDMSVYAMDDQNVLLLRFVFTSFNTLAFDSMYFFLICKVYSAFKGSAYAIKKCVIAIHSAICLTATLTVMVSFAMAIFNYDKYALKLPVALCLLLPFSAFFHLFYTFNHGLFHIVLQQRQQQSLKHDRIMAAARKHTIIGISVMLMGFLGFATYIIALVIEGGDYFLLSVYPNSKAYKIVFDIMIVPALNLTSFVLFLGFAVNQALYKGLCNLCDATIASLCETLVQSQLNKKGQPIAGD